MTRFWQRVLRLWRGHRRREMHWWEAIDGFD